MEKTWGIAYIGERTFHECEGRLFDASRSIEYDPITLQEIKKKEPKVEVIEKVTVSVSEPIETITVAEQPIVPSEPEMVTENPLKCSICGYVSGSNAGKSAHDRAHKRKNEG